MYFLNWAMTAIVDSTAVALYVKYWSAFSAVPQWLLALIALAVVLSINLISVRLFGEMEFWFAIVKVAAILLFLVAGIVLLATQHRVGGQTPGFHMISDHGGWFPRGIAQTVIVLQGVVFAYAAIEMVGVTAGETAEPARVVPRAINSITWRIALFYVGSVVLLVLLLPWTAYHAGESPFVTVFSKMGVPAIGGVMNLVVLTAAMSSLNSGLYSTGRILRSLAAAGSAPKFTGRMSARAVPYGGIFLTAGFALIGVGLNAWLPGEAFDIVVNIASLGVISTWVMIMVCHALFVRRAKAGHAVRPAYRLGGSPWTEIVTIAFLVFVTVEMGAQGGTVGRWTVLLIIPVAAALTAGWYAIRRRD
jgi:L-asparagine permease